MDEETKKKFDAAEASAKEATEKAETAAKDLEAEKASREEDRVAHEKAVAEKDVIIEQKKNDVIGARRKYKKLADMSAEEKEDLTEKELELQKRQEEQEERQVKFEEKQKEATEKETKARREGIIKSMSGDDEELEGKIMANYEKLSASSKATTEDEIKSIANDAFNMLGIPKAEGVSNVITNGGDGGTGKNEDTDFSETEKGKNIAASLNLEQSKVAEDTGGDK